MCGLTTEQIARAFLVRETAIARRITRAKRKITDAGIPYRVPADDELASRLSEVLAVIYLLFIALRYTIGAQGAMAELDDLGSALGEYHLYHASRAELLRALGQPEQARAADQRALELTNNPAEQAILHQRLAWR